MGDKYEDDFTCAGGAFIAKYYCRIADYIGNNADLVDSIFAEGTDSKRSKTSSRVSCVKRIIREGESTKALIKIRDSKIIIRQNPEACRMSRQILEERFGVFNSVK